MKVLLKLIFFVAVLGAAYYFGEPRLREFLKSRSEESATPAGEADAPAGPGVVAERPRQRAESVPRPPEANEVTRPEAPKREMSEAEKASLELYPMPEIPPLMELVDNWNGVPERAFPRQVVIQAEVELDLKRDGQVIGRRMVESGTTVVARGLENGRLTVTPEGSDLMTGVIGIDETDFKATIEEGYRAYISRTRKRILELREAERIRIERQIAEAKYRPAGWTDGSAAIFAPMRASLARGEAKELLLEDAKKWRWIGPETIRGVEYDTALVVMEVETIFGIFSSEMKALMRNGKVEKWVDPVSGNEF